MKLWIFILSATLLLSCSENRFDASVLNFELHLANTESGPDLKQMNLYRTDQNFFVDSFIYLTSDDVKSAEVIEWETQPKVIVKLNERGRNRFAAFTLRHVGKNAAMIVDHELVSAPRINAQITTGELIIVGFFSYKEAVGIANGIVKKE
ncbi:MAG: hypothetical protein E4H13_05295 [Calditrichales bacterium]|nr:MAG: hypothetical protein E4H13_05295 [Calditrichales bacterium]